MLRLGWINCKNILFVFLASISVWATFEKFIKNKSKSTAYNAFFDKFNASSSSVAVPTLPKKRLIYVITPTKWRLEQMADLTRLAQTLAFDGGIHWILVEDNNATSPRIESLLKRFTFFLAGTTHLFVETPENEKLNEGELRNRPRGHHQRNEALAWLRQREFSKYEKEAVLYFADDDNSYDVRLFERMRNLKKFGVWPVGLVGYMLYGGPICDSSHSRVVNFRVAYLPDRFCPCDMAGFAVSLELFLEQKHARFPVTQNGMLEAAFVAGLFNASPRSINLTIFEPIVCDEILVWHTRTAESKLNSEKILMEKQPPTLEV